MPRVHKQRANKDYPDQGIAKGDTYYKWKFRYSPVVRSKTPPTTLPAHAVGAPVGGIRS